MMLLVVDGVQTHIQIALLRPEDFLAQATRGKWYMSLCFCCAAPRGSSLVERNADLTVRSSAMSFLSERS